MAKLINYTFILLFVLFVAGLNTTQAACPSDTTHSTPYNSDNGQRGIMFDVVATNTITVKCFDVNLYAGTTARYMIYYRRGTHVGHENNANSWTFIDSVSNITSLGNNIPTPLPIDVNVVIGAGETVAFYITNDFGGGTSYTDGTAVGNLLSSDNNLSVYEGVGKSYPFALTFTVRKFNGTIYYDTGGVIPVELTAFTAEATHQGNLLNWETSTELNNEGFYVQHSIDGERWENLDFVEGYGTTFEPQYYNFLHTQHPLGLNYYRLKQVDFDGAFEYSDVLTIENHTERTEMQLYPNPVVNEVRILGGTGDITIYTLLGQPIREMKISQSPFTVSLADLPKGQYILRLRREDNTVATKQFIKS